MPILKRTISAQDAADILKIPLSGIERLEKLGILNVIHTKNGVHYFSQENISLIQSRKGLTLAQEASQVGNQIQKETVLSLSNVQKAIIFAGVFAGGYLFAAVVIFFLFLTAPLQTSDFFGYYYRFNTTRAQASIFFGEGKSVLAAATGPTSADISQTSVLADALLPATTLSLVAVKAVNSQLHQQITTGPTGGPAGPAGSPGPPGANGIDGLPGASGLQGPAGADGSNGTNGSNGSAGSNGSNGTNGTSFTDVMTTAGDIVIRDGTNTTVRLGAGTTGQILTITGGIPAWENATGGGTSFSALTSGTNTTGLFVVGSGASLSATGSGTIMATGFSGILPVANGGTGVGTFSLNGVLFGNNTSAVQTTSAPTSGQVLLGNGSGIPTFTTLSSDATVNGSGAVTLKNVGTAGTYGSALIIPVFTTDAQGRITGVVPTTISGLTVANFSSSNISQWTNDAGYITATGSAILTNKTISGLTNTLSNISNGSLTNSSLTINTTGPLTGGGLVSLGGNLTLSCPSCVATGGALFTAAATSGSSSSISQGGTLTLAAGSNLTTTNNGTGTITFATIANPTFTTVNGLTITNNGTNTLNIAAGKTATISSSLTFTGTDGTTFVFPTTSDDVVGRTVSQTITNKTIAAGSNTITGLTVVNFTSSNISQWTNDSGYISSSSADILTNKTISGLSNTLTNIANGSLTNSSLTVSAGTGLNGGGLVSLGGTVTLSLPNVGTSGTYGSALSIPVFTTDAQGRVTGVTPTTISGLTVSNFGSALISQWTNDAGYITATGSAILTNKTLSGLSNTFTNIPNNGLTNSLINLAGNSGTGSVSLGGTLTLTGAGIATVSASGSTLTLTATEADTLQSVYDRGSTITTTTGRNIAFTLPAGLVSPTSLTVTNNGTADSLIITDAANANIDGATRRSLYINPGTITQNTAASTGTYSGLDIALPALTLTNGTALTGNGIRVTTDGLTQTTGTLTENGLLVDSTSSVITTGGTLNGIKINAPTTLPSVGTYNNLFLGTSTNAVANTQDVATIAVGSIAATAQQNFSTLNITNGGSGFLDVELLHGMLNFQGMNTLYDDFTDRVLNTTNRWTATVTGANSSCSILAGGLGGLLRMVAGNGGANRACELTTQAIGTLTNGFYQRNNNPVFETKVTLNSLANDIAYAGFTATRVTVGSNTNASTHHAYIAKRSTDTNWQCVTDDGGATETYRDTNVAVQTGVAYRLRVELRDGTTPETICTVDNGTTTTRTVVTETQPGITNPMDAYLSIAVTANTTAKNMDVDYVRTWQDDPVVSGLVVDNSLSTSSVLAADILPSPTPVPPIPTTLDSLAELLGSVSATLNPTDSQSGLSTLIADIQKEESQNPIAMLEKKIADGKQFLTNFFAARITAIQGNFDEIFARTVHTKQLCITSSDGSETCVNGDQLHSILNTVASPTPTDQIVPTPTIPTAVPTPLITPTPTEEIASPSAMVTP